jgi:hypothetical protein
VTINSAGFPQMVTFTYEPVAAVGGQIRRRLRVLLSTWGLVAETVEDALLVVEELVANVVDHARTRFRLTVQLVGSLLRIAIQDFLGAVAAGPAIDSGGTSVTRAAAGRQPGPDVGLRPPPRGRQDGMGRAGRLSVPHLLQ